MARLEPGDASGHAVVISALASESSEDGQEASTWAPLQTPVFRALWLASLVGVTGSWLQTVGAQWLLVHRPHAAILVALVQTAEALPFVVFGLIAGVLADTLNRRRLLIATQMAVAALGALLAGLTFAHTMPPALLLLLTFLLGSGEVLGTPAYQSLLPELVPRSQVPAASALNSIAINVARAVGPAVAGLLIAQAGVGVTFAVASASAVWYTGVVARWRPPHAEAGIPEPFTAALRAGERYVRHAYVVRRIMLRAALFLVPASSLFALLPLVASRRLALGSGGYGLLLAALGVGAIAGALLLPSVRSRMSANQMITTASGVYALALAVIATLRDVVPAIALLVPAGVAWVVVLSNVNASLQLFLPTWVRGRSLAAYQMVLFGSQALGALLFGVLAGRIGLAPSLLAAAGVAAAAAATIRIWPFIDTTGMDRSTVVYWPQPQLAADVDAAGRPVVVTVRYQVPSANAQSFLEAMSRVRESRYRTGAIRWGLYRDGEDGDTYVELFAVPSWEEHQRQHSERLTGTDREFQQRTIELLDGLPEVSHLISVAVPD